MDLKNLSKFVVAASLCMLFGCGGGGGSGANGLNGSVGLETSVSGTIITATATYKHPTRVDLIGVPISFSYFDGSKYFDLGTHSTNNSGSITLAFQPSAFTGTKDIVVEVKTGNVSNFSVVSLTGSTITMAPPVSDAQIADATTPNDTAVIFTLNTANFLTITDPFSNNVSNHPISIGATFTATPGSGSAQDALIPLPPYSSVTNSTGVAALNGVGIQVGFPNTVSTRTITITWTATDLVTGFQSVGATTLTVSRSALAL